MKKLFLFSLLSVLQITMQAEISESQVNAFTQEQLNAMMEQCSIVKTKIQALRAFLSYVTINSDVILYRTELDRMTQELATSLIDLKKFHMVFGFHEQIKEIDKLMSKLFKIARIHLDDHVNGFMVGLGGITLSSYVALIAQMEKKCSCFIAHLDKQCLQREENTLYRQTCHNVQMMAGTAAALCAAYLLKKLYDLARTHSKIDYVENYFVGNKEKLQTTMNALMDLSRPQN